MVDYLFLSKDIHRIQATTDKGNAASHEVLEKVGFKKEGILRKKWFMNGGWKTLPCSASSEKNGKNQKY